MKRTFERYQSELQFVVCLLLSGLSSLAVHCNFTVAGGRVSGFGATFFHRLSQSFTFTGFADILVFAAVFFAVRHVILHDSCIDIGTAILAAVFSFLYVVVESYYRYQTAAFIRENGYQVFIAGLCFLGFFVLFYVLLRVMFIFLDERGDGFFVREGRVVVSSHCWLIGFLVIFVCHLPWILVNYPGSTIPDAATQIAQFYGDYKFSAHHPPLMTYIFGMFLELGDLVWDKNFGFFLFILFQTVTGAAIYSYGIMRLHKVGGVRLRYCLIGVLFFGLTPMWGSFAQSLQKDVLYTEIITLFEIWLIDSAVRKECTKKDAAAFIVIGVLSALLRKNGLYAVVPSVIVLALILKKEMRKRAVVSVISILLIYSAVTKFLYPVVLGIEDGSIREALSIPFQQTACYVVNYGDDVTEAEREVINVFLEYDKIAQRYDPTISDPVKDLYKGNIHLTFERAKGLAVYFWVWFKMFFKHPDAYISAAVNMSYGYIAPVGTRVGAEITPHCEKEIPYLAQIGLKWSGSGEAAAMFGYLLGAVVGIPILCFFAMPGFYTWIMIVSMFIMAKKKRLWGAPAVIFIPWIMNVLICIASPLGNSMRYALPVAAGAPFMIGWALYFSHAGTCGGKTKESG